MKKLNLLITFLVFTVLTNAQENTNSYPNFIGKDLSTIENNLDWKILQKASGDLNNDNSSDMVLILESTDSILTKRNEVSKALKNKPRIIVVLLNENNTQSAIIQNNKFIPPGDEGGMLPYLEPELTIKNGLLSISYQYTRSEKSYTFAYKNKQMMITAANFSGVTQAAIGTFEINSYDFKKGIIVHEIGNISEEASTSQTLKLNVTAKSLSDFDEINEWEVAKDMFL